MTAPTKHHIGEWPGVATYLQRATRLALGFTYLHTDRYAPRHGREWDCAACLDTGLVTAADPAVPSNVVIHACPHGCPPVYGSTDDKQSIRTVIAATTAATRTE